MNPTPALGEMESTNPCGELPLLPFEACNLASIDVGKLVRRRAGSIGRGWASWCALGVRFLDDVIDVNHYPLPQIEAITRGNRKIGLGVMGFADALIRLGVAYDSEAALRRRRRARRASSSSTRRRRRPSWRASAGRSPTGRDRAGRSAGAPPLRNATTTTIAPTGTHQHPGRLLGRDRAALRGLVRAPGARRRAAGRRASAVRRGGARGRLVLGRR